jgi:heterodisulfide reductase subunit D
LVELSARNATRFAPAPVPLTSEPLRYHDSCALGRGLGLFEAPRRLLALVAGAAPLELERTRELGRCSGAGGILPVSMPEIAKGAADRLLDEHRRLGGGTLVTSCASSLSLLRSRGASAVDLISLLEQGLQE